MKKAPSHFAPRRQTRICLFVVVFTLSFLLAAASFFHYHRHHQQQVVSPPETSSAKDEDEEEEKEREFEANSVLQSTSAPQQEQDGDAVDVLSNYVVGFPLKPLSLAELKLCDEKQTIILEGSFRCAADPSCLACVPKHQAERFQELHGAFRDPALTKPRNEKIAKDFAGQRTIVMFTFNYAHSDLFLNWACNAEKLGMDVRAFTLVIPCDERTNELVQSLGFKVLDPSWQSKLSKQIRQGESYWGQDHADINNVALFAMNDLVALGFHVFVHDADIAWLRDPFPFFAEASKRRDFLGMLAPFWNSMGPVNTGLLYIAPTFQTKVFLQSMENAAIVKGTSDQRLWNAILRHYTFQQLEWRLLPQEIVYKYSGSRAAPPGRETLLMHAVGSGKREKLARFGLWLMDSKCPFYNEESDRLNRKERQVAK